MAKRKLIPRGLLSVLADQDAPNTHLRCILRSKAAIALQHGRVRALLGARQIIIGAADFVEE